MSGQAVFYMLQEMLIARLGKIRIAVRSNSQIYMHVSSVRKLLFCNYWPAPVVNTVLSLGKLLP
jgi:hypothetical protein